MAKKLLLRILPFCMLVLVIKSSQAIDLELIKPAPQNNGIITLKDFNPTLGTHFWNIDTNNTYIHQIDANTKGHFLNLGNAGSFAFPLIGINTSNANGFNSGMNLYPRNNYISLDDVTLHHSRVPFTRINYSQGPNEFQYFKGEYSVNIKPNFNISLQHQKLSSEGTYINQATATRSTNLNFWYKSLSGRYTAIGMLIFNRYLQNENGGINQDSLFQKTGFIGSSSILTGAKSSYRNRTYYFDQYYFLGKKDTFEKEKGDSSKKTYSIIKQKMFFQWKNSVLWERQEFADLGLDYKFFPATRYTLTTGERNLSQKISSDFFYGILNNDSNQSMNSKIGIAQEFIEYTSFSIPYKFSNTKLLFNTKYESFKDSFFVDLNANYILNGINQSNFAIKLDARKSFRNITMFAGVNLQKYRPDQVYFTQYGNHFYWQKESLKAQNQFLFNAGIYLNKWRLSSFVSYQQKGNYIYFADNFIPYQTANTVSSFSWRNIQESTIGILNFKNDIVVQNIIRGKSLYRIPTISYRGSLFLKFNLFKKALNLKTGADIRISSKFEPMFYIPEIQQFSIIKNGSAGNYPFVDFWINAEIKSFNVYFILENLASNIGPYKYYSLPYYPMPPTQFLRLGIQWRFRN